MYCRQCEQTAQSVACTVRGVCGKPSEVAGLLDVLLYGLVEIAVFEKRRRALGIKDSDTDTYIMEGLFATITNVDFDPQRIAALIRKGYTVKEKVKNSFLKACRDKTGQDCKDIVSGAVDWKPADTIEAMLQQSADVGIQSYPAKNDDVRSLKEILLYGIKGMAAYADHASILGAEDETVLSFFSKALCAVADPDIESQALISLIMEFGKINLRCMEVLDSVHTKTFGDPVPTKVFRGVKRGPAIIVSGHDLKDLCDLLEQTKGSGINIYTHGEMLPAHGYPELQKYNHLAGHFGTAWQNQQKEFDGIAAVILMTTNCIQEPKSSYKDRIFTTGLVAWPGIPHVDCVNGKKDFSPLIKKARELTGFSEEKKECETMTGFGHKALENAAGAVVDLVRQKKIRHFFLIGGCDGAKPGRNYYAEFARKVPPDCVIITLACGKFRFNNLDFGVIEGIPRLLDCGQCNDAYSAVRIATALAQSFNCGVNDLPLSMVLSWYEQKAVAILLTLLSLGIKNIRLGPTLPAFVSPNVFKVLHDNFNIKPITTVEEDMTAILG